LAEVIVVIIIIIIIIIIIRGLPGRATSARLIVLRPCLTQTHCTAVLS